MPNYVSGSVSLHYEERPAAGVPERTLVFVHGWTGRGAGWRTLMDSLSESYDSFAPDLRGCGESDHPPGGYTIEQYASDVFTLCELKGIANVDLVGHSMGGAVALTL
ncbi:MAG TPA: alpha/beta fold hydrolase, partial [Dehalococcoidia bacterium]|nr:alpha/beta fold hydrolase [Dehalococcoidia bacterium]